MSPHPPSGGHPAARLCVLGATELSGADARAVGSGAVQPKRLVLLTYLALASSRGFVRRDTLLALFWPELPSDQARHALRQSLHYLRTTFGRDAVVGRGDTELAVSPDHLWCDADEFGRCLAVGEPAAAMVLHRGELLEGVHVPDVAPELEQWLDTERLRFRRLASGAAASLSREAEATDPREAIAWARRASSLDPDDETAVRALMDLLDRHGDRVGALRVYEELKQRLSEEYGTSPSVQTRELRARLGIAAPLPELAASAGMREATSTPMPEREAGSPSSRWRVLVPRGLIVLGVLLIGVALPLLVGGLRAPARNTVLAVGLIEAEGDSTSSLQDGAGNLRLQLVSGLSQLQGLQVLSDGRLHEMVARGRGSMDRRPDIIAAARRAGATELVEGELRRAADGYRLDVQRVRLEGGTLLGTIRLESERVEDLALQVISSMAAAHRIPPALRSQGALTSRSPAARRSYERGLRALYSGEIAEARRQLSAALELDPEFFAAAYYAASIAQTTEQWNSLHERIARAVAAADSAPERERLQIRTMWGVMSSDPRAVSYAESLATRYPAEPEGRYHLGVALSYAGDFPGAIEQLKLAIDADSVLLASAVTSEAPCRACQAIAMVVGCYINMDSVEAAIRWADRLRKALPANADQAKGAQAYLLTLSGRPREAVGVLRDSMSNPLSADGRYLLVDAHLRTAEFGELQRYLDEEARLAGGQRNVEVLWYDMLHQHTRGRLRSALSASRRFCAGPARYHACDQIRAPLLIQLGRAKEALSGLEARLAIPDTNSTLLPFGDARGTAWLMVHVAEARAAAGDTASLWRLADSIEAVGRLSGYGRDRRLHHHARGLLYRARGQLALAAAEFSDAEFSPVNSYSQSRYYRAEMLMEQNRPAEAVEVLDPLLRRGMSSMGSYLSQADVHALLAAALSAAGRKEEALSHLRWAESAWEEADPEIRVKLEKVRLAVEKPEAGQPYWWLPASTPSAAVTGSGSSSRIRTP